mmetsp:Transcript_24360/g.75199  ORF Transcript_24360/g.75199 Transcript_24360/m.75199 type:complete len:200 (+) Transcript_24360:507-1106(+)
MKNKTSLFKMCEINLDLSHNNSNNNNKKQRLAGVEEGVGGVREEVGVFGGRVVTEVAVGADFGDEFVERLELRLVADVREDDHLQSSPVEVVGEVVEQPALDGLLLDGVVALEVRVPADAHGHLVHAVVRAVHDARPRQVNPVPRRLRKFQNGLLVRLQRGPAVLGQVPSYRQIRRREPQLRRAAAKAPHHLGRQAHHR